jgi:hypothetical protein
MSFLGTIRLKHLPLTTDNGQPPMSDVRTFGAVGDGRTDDTEAIEHALQDGEGTLEFPRGEYLISRPIMVDLDRLGRTGISGAAGTATLVMAAAGPALHFVGTHKKNADPSGFGAEIWQRQRLPTVSNLEIIGRHEEAEGVRFEGTMQSTLEGVLLRKLRHGIVAHDRCRNLLISHCHVYDLTGVGVFLDRVNLHQAIIVGSHISYCKRGGIKIVGSEIRNLQITGNDIEYNFDPQADASADVWIDSTAPGASVREVTIASNTIQAKYSPGGANVRILGHDPVLNHKAGLTTISGNLIGSQNVNIHLHACRGIVVTGNTLYSGHHRNVLVEHSRNVVLSGNVFDHNPDYKTNELCTGIRLVDSADIGLNGTVIQDSQAGKHTVPGAVPIEREAMVEVVRCRRATITGCHLVDGAPTQLLVEASSFVHLNGCSILESRTDRLTDVPILWRGEGKGNFASGNLIESGRDGGPKIAAEADVESGENRVI